MADTSVKLSGTYDSIEAYNIMVEMQNMSADYEEIRTEAAAAASAATAAVTTAQTAANSASTYAGNAQTYAGNANSSASEAAGYASDASTSATNAASSETNASNSATAAHNSEVAAAASEAVVNGALPLTGGTMTGEIVFSGLDAHGGDSAIQCSTDDDGVRITGATAGNKGASIIVYGKDATNSAGCFIHSARDGVNTVELKGKPNGELTWNGNSVITSAITGNVLSASGSFSTKQAVTEACRISTHAAGVWLIVGYADLSGGSNSVYNTYIITNNITRYTRCPGSGGGGVVNVYIATLAENEVVKFSGYLPSDATGNFRGSMQMVRLA